MLFSAGTRPARGGHLDLLLNAVQGHEVELVYLLLARGAPVNDRIAYPEYDDDASGPQTAEEEAEEEAVWRQLYGMHGRSPLELCSDGSNLVNSCAPPYEDAWTLTKLVLLAGGTGDSLRYTGACFYEDVVYLLSLC